MSHVIFRHRKSKDLIAKVTVGNEVQEHLVPVASVSVELIGGPVTAREFVKELLVPENLRFFETTDVVLIKGHGPKSFFMMFPSIFPQATAIAMFNSYRGCYVVVATRCDYYNLGDEIPNIS